MKPPHRRSTLVVLLGASANAFAQRGVTTPATTAQERPGEPPDVKLPNGKSQRDEILKADHEKNLKDAAELVDLVQQLQLDIEKDDAFVFSLTTLKKTDDIEKLVKRIHARLRHN
jgi:hypothetical protein